ncbi:MAG: EVE domain-containing protein [Fibrobacteres bacterium]|nr:EVE domain-containing protein [Fibrobacterota bacterium]
MRHWLLKSEPDAYSWDTLVHEKTGRWDGVRNYMARNNLRAMSVGDQCLFYHSVKEKAVVGICQVSRTAYPDPTAETGDWSCVEVKPLKPLDRPVTLESIKAEHALAQIAMLKYNRLSVVPLTPEEFAHILEMGSAG